MTAADMSRELKRWADALSDLRSQQANLTSTVDGMKREVAEGLGDFTQTLKGQNYQARQEMDDLANQMGDYLAKIQGTQEDHTEDVGWRMLAFGLLIGLCALTWTEAQLYVLLAPLFGAMIPVCFPGIRRVIGRQYQRMIAKLLQVGSISQPTVQTAAAVALHDTVEHVAPPVHANGRH